MAFALFGVGYSVPVSNVQFRIYIFAFWNSNATPFFAQDHLSLSTKAPYTEVRLEVMPVSRWLPSLIFKDMRTIWCAFNKILKHQESKLGLCPQMIDTSRARDKRSEYDFQQTVNGFVRAFKTARYHYRHDFLENPRRLLSSKKPAKISSQLR